MNHAGPGAVPGGASGARGRMLSVERIAEGLERWNALAPMLPVWLDAHGLALALPFALAGLLLLGAFACARRALRPSAALPRIPVIPRLAGVPVRQHPRDPRRLEPGRPRGPTSARPAAA